MPITDKLIKYISYTCKVLEGLVLGKNIPILVTLCVTNRCNLKCIYCYQGNDKSVRDEFSTQKLLKLIDELAAMGTKYISINGGECLLRDDIEQIVNRVLEKKMLCHLSTNGIISQKYITVLKKVDSLSISVDGRKESNDLNRGKGSYEKIIATLECLKQNNINFQTHTVLTANNKDSIEEIMELAIQFSVKAQFSILRMEDSPDEKISLNDEEVKDVLKKIIELKKRGYPVFFSTSSYEKALNWPFSYEKQMSFSPVNGKKQKCNIKRFACHIEADGMVYPCVVLVGKFKALNLRETGFKNAWDNLSSCKCTACYNICHSDINSILGLKPEVIKNAIAIAYRRMFTVNRKN